jgi:Domain of unknown function (DUF4430)
LSRSRPKTAVAIALPLAALAAAGCGLGPGEGLGDVSLTVTRDYGAERVLEAKADEATESDTVMRVLDRNAEISTRYGGGFVQSIEGLEATDGGGGPRDWFFYVNGVESTVGAADYPLHGGEAIWWDYRDWGAAMRVPAVVGSWPQPFAGGYEGRRRPVAVECRGGGGACGVVRQRLAGVGAAVGAGAPDDAIRVLVGPWSRLRDDPAAAQIEDGPQASGVFADFSLHGPRSPRPPRCRLETLDESGRPLDGADPGAGLVAATRRYEAPPTWVVTGCGDRAVARAASALDEDDLRDRYAVLVEDDGDVVPLPLPERGAR